MQTLNQQAEQTANHASHVRTDRWTKHMQDQVGDRVVEQIIIVFFFFWVYIYRLKIWIIESGLVLRIKLINQ
jgi:hypothetical protein